MSYQNVVTSTTLDDRDLGNITYAGNRPWTVHTNVQSIFHLYQDSDTFTDEQYATATLRFYGTAVEYWGNQGPYHGPCLITLDGTDMGTINSHAEVDDDPILLYSNNNLELGDHTMVITVMGAQYPNVCEVDRFVVNVTNAVIYTSSYVYTGPGSEPTGGFIPGINDDDNSNNGNDNDGDTSNPTSSGSSSPPVAAIAGAVGGVAVLAFLLVGWWFWRRSRRNKHQKKVPAPALLKDTGDGSPFVGDANSAVEKGPYSAPRPEHNGHPSSYAPSTPPASSYSPPSMAAYNQYASGAHSAAPSPLASPPTSPQPLLRPMSTVSSTPTVTTGPHYTPGVPLAESSFPGFIPHQQATATPVWATPANTISEYSDPHRPPSTSPAPTTPIPPTSPAPTTLSAPLSEAAAEAQLPEKARYRGATAFKGDVKGGTSSSAGGGSSGAGSSSTGAGPSRSQGADTLMSPGVPDQPPPAYQL